MRESMAHPSSRSRAKTAVRVLLIGFLAVLLVATVAWQGVRTALANPAVQIRNE